MKKARCILIMSGLLFVELCAGGCRSTEIKPEESAAIDVTRYESPDKGNTGTVTGRAFIRTRDGGIMTLAGETVRIQPKGLYSDQWYDLASNMQIHRAAYDHRVEDYVFMTKIDNDGRFIFEDVPAGEYYLTTQIFRITPDRFRPEHVYSAQFRREINVEAGKTLDVVLSR